MMKMDITKRRKMMALFLAGTLTVSAAVTGCGRKNVDYNVDNTQPKQTEADLGQTETSASGEDLDSGSLWSKYKIPFTCDTEIAIGDTGLSKIHVTDDDISVPDTSDLQIAQYKKKDPESNEVKKQVAENLFDKDEGIYVYDSMHRIKRTFRQRSHSIRQQRRIIRILYLRIPMIHGSAIWKRNWQMPRTVIRLPEIIPRMIMLVLWMGRNMNCITKQTAFIVPLICGKIL